MEITSFEMACKFLQFYREALGAKLVEVPQAPTVYDGMIEEWKASSSVNVDHKTFKRYLELIKGHVAVLEANWDEHLAKQKEIAQVIEGLEFEINARKRKEAPEPPACAEAKKPAAVVAPVKK